MHLAMTDLYRAKWTQQIHDEWMRNVLKDRQDLTYAQLERTRSLMDKNIRDCLVEGYEYLTPCLELPDTDDQHVLAAAIHSKSSVIVTFNLKDFPPASLDPYEIEAQHPDEFIAHLIDLNPALVLEAVRCCRASLKKPAMTQDEYLDCLLKQGLPETVTQLRQWVLMF